ncbi:phosphatidate phosphatase APP1 [Hymenobacter luteus]|uniref:Phosphatidate phosphatase APP1 n=2 Tax=Hymenobacter TaxID=89966 RepID=A0A7W9T1W5_9BACT|nr:MULTISPECIES: phosphatase domain-containing protein [Hymenobacter]MBB4602068.1 phosphatidate phosphatase APP1 [Hymenobacter latericoloratus]MBB6059503.1 phosphatidate phosphatase APP1 [Hymenobacter luteus]
MPLLDKLSSWAERADDALTRARARLGLLHPLQLLSYRSYGTPSRLYVKGRLLTDKGIGEPDPTDSRWHNLLNMYRRFDSNEISGAQLQVRPADGSEHSVVTDEEGYFTLNLEPKQLPEPVDFLWYPVDVLLRQAPAPFPTPEKLDTRAMVLIPPADAEYGIISDLDDTVIQTSATDLLRMARTVLLRNARSRLPFKGVAEFYRQLQLGRNGKRNNPFFYVSSSPWNLYDLLEDFLNLNDVPPGPLLLRDMALKRKQNTDASEHHGHKLKEIDNLLLTYPTLPFVLIGDSGQEDANIYREVVRRHPGRILAIYIRDVNRPDRAALVEQVSEDLRSDKVEMLLVQDTVQAAHHAAATGLIFQEAIPAVEQEKQKDEAAADDTELDGEGTGEPVMK